MDRETYFTVTQLKARGWSDALVRDLLAAPDATRRNPRCGSAGPLRLYLRARALAVERSDQWPALLERAASRRAAAGLAVRTKQGRLRAYVEALEVRVPAIPLDRAVARACEEFNAFKGAVALERCDPDFRAATAGSDPAFLRRIAVNYLRHRLSDYDEELDHMFGRVGVREAYAALNEKVYAAIGAAYPELAGECRRQTERKGQPTL